MIDDAFRQPVAGEVRLRVATLVGERKYDYSTRARRYTLRDLRSKPVAAATDCLYILGSLGGILEGFTQPAYRRIDAVVEFDDDSVRPQMLAKLFASHHVAGPLQQDGQDLKRLFGEAHRA